MGLSISGASSLRISVAISLLALAVAATGALLLRPSPPPHRLSPMEKILRAQQELPAPALRALQDLRVVASVQITHFTEKQRYGSVQELKSGKYLDPNWPSAEPGAYKISCNVEPERPYFVCLADAVSRQGLFFRVDPSQAVRYRRGSRPEAGSPVFGISKETQ